MNQSTFVSDRAKQVILGLMFWVVFVIPDLICKLLQPIAILIYALGNDHIRNWIYRTGKAMDQADNTAWFGGLPQETISSHVGRYYELKYGNLYATQTVQINPDLIIPWKCKFVHWLTNLFETDHCLKAIESPFRGMEL